MVEQGASYAEREAMKKAPVTVWFGNECDTLCESAQALLKNRGIAYSEQRIKVYLLLCFLFIFSTTSFCHQIMLDESFDDWNNQNYSFKDKSGDNNSSGIDFTEVKISNDDRYLYLYFDINKEINIQENNNLTLYIDIDNNASTGINKYGVGAFSVFSRIKKWSDISRLFCLHHIS